MQATRPLKKPDNQDQKKAKKEYNKLIRDHKKKLKKLCNEADPSDYGFALDYFVEYLRFMRDYYELGYNVLGVENEGEKKRLDSLNEAIKEIEDYWKAYDVFYEFHETGGKENKRGATIKHSDGTTELTDFWIEPKCSKDEDENRRLLQRYEERHWKGFWDFICRYLQDWWD